MNELVGFLCVCVCVDRMSRKRTALEAIEEDCVASPLASVQLPCWWVDLLHEFHREPRSLFSALPADVLCIIGDFVGPALDQCTRQRLLRVGDTVSAQHAASQISPRNYVYAATHAWRASTGDMLVCIGSMIERGPMVALDAWAMLVQALSWEPNAREFVARNGLLWLVSAETSMSRAQFDVALRLVRHRSLRAIMEPFVDTLCRLVTWNMSCELDRNNQLREFIMREYLATAAAVPRFASAMVSSSQWSRVAVPADLCGPVAVSYLCHAGHNAEAVDKAIDIATTARTSTGLVPLFSSLDFRALDKAAHAVCTTAALHWCSVLRLDLPSNARHFAAFLHECTRLCDATQEADESLASWREWITAAQSYVTATNDDGLCASFGGLVDSVYQRTQPEFITLRDAEPAVRMLMRAERSHTARRLVEHMHELVDCLVPDQQDD